MSKINQFNRRTISILLIALTLFGLACKKDHPADSPAAFSQPKNMLYVGSEDHNFYALSSVNGTEVWKYAGTAEFTYSNPVVYGKNVYAGDTGGNMYAFDSRTGEVKWKYAAGTQGIESSAAVADDIIYFGSNDHNFYALNAQDGHLLWKFETTQNVSSSPKVVNGIVYFGSSDNYIYALNAKTGGVIWKYETQGPIGESSPAVSNGVVFIGSRDGYLYALNAAGGQLKWKYSAGGISLENSSPAISNGLVYIAGGYGGTNFEAKGAFYAVDEATGSLAWKALNNTGMSSSPMVNNNKVYISADDLNFHALDAKDGTSIWAKQIVPNGAGSVSANGVVFVGGGGTSAFYALDESNGAEKWKNTSIQGLMTSTPCLIDANGVIVKR